MSSKKEILSEKKTVDGKPQELNFPFFADVDQKDLVEYTNKVAQKSRLRKNGLDDVIEYCLTPDLTEIIPVLKDNYLTTINRLVTNKTI